MARLPYLAALACAIPLLSSCGNRALSVPESSPHAVLVNSYPESEQHYETYQVHAVDGKPVDYTHVAGRRLKLRLAPGPHRIAVRGRYSGSFMATRYMAEADLSLLVKEGSRYSVRGEIDGIEVKLWIADDAKGKPETRIVQAPRTIEPLPTPPLIVPVPIG